MTVQLHLLSSCHVQDTVRSALFFPLIFTWPYEVSLSLFFPFYRSGINGKREAEALTHGTTDNRRLSCDRNLKRLALELIFLTVTFSCFSQTWHWAGKEKKNHSLWNPAELAGAHTRYTLSKRQLLVALKENLVEVKRKYLYKDNHIVGKVECLLKTT